jgi:hypothetical protein
MKSVIASVSLAVALTLTAFALPAAAQAAPDPTGDWAVEVDMGGTPLMAKLNVVKNDDGTYGGTLNSPMGIMTLEKVDYTPGESISFAETIGEGETAISFTFEGKFSDADHFEGKLVSETMGEMLVKGTRGGLDNPLAGVWSITSDSQLGKLERKLVVYKNSSGKYCSEDAEYKISNLAVEGDAVKFDVTVSAQGQDLPLHFVGTRAGDTLSGNFQMDGQDVATVTGAKATVDIVGAAAGKWDLAADTPLGPYEAKLEIGPGATGKLVSAEGESPLQNLGADGDMLEFDVAVLFQGESYNVSFEGTPKGDELAGDFIMDGSPVATVVCKKGS